MREVRALRKRMTPPIKTGGVMRNTTIEPFQQAARAAKEGYSSIL
jgi:hypothetical protein